jgi:hypothetical protein
MKDADSCTRQSREVCAYRAAIGLATTPPEGPSEKAMLELVAIWFESGITRLFTM